MKLLLKQPIFLHEKGLKEDNEDFVYPIAGEVTPESRLFIVSDGDKGSSINRNDHGGSASQIVAMSIATHFMNVLKEGDADQSHLDKAVAQAQDSLLNYLVRNSDSGGISASFSLVHLGSTRVTLAWVGDSRVYHYNSNLKTISGSDQWEQDMENPAPHARLKGHNKDEIKVRLRSIPIEDLHPGDFFFLATSGMDQEAHPASLKAVFSNSKDSAPEAIMEEIHNLVVNGLAKENHSAYLIPIESIKTDQGREPVAATVAAASSATTTDTDAKSSRDLTENMSRYLGWGIGGAFGLAILALILVAIIQSRDNPFEKVVNDGSIHLQMGRDASIDKDFELSIKEFRIAQSLFDSASTIAQTDQERRYVDSMKLQTANFMSTILPSMELVDLPLDQLDLTPGQYVKEGNEFMDKGNALAALQAYRNAQRLLESTQGPDSIMPAKRVAEAYLIVIKELSQDPSKDCEKIVSFYQSAMELDGKELVAAPQPLFEEATLFANSCEAQLAANKQEVAPETPTATDLIADATNQRTRSLTSTDNTPAKAPATTSVPASAPNARVRASEPEISAADMAELKRLLSEGKRQFVEAKDKNSNFLYSASADKLEQSGKAIDGAGAYLLAYMYHSGLGVTPDPAKALTYAQQSARLHWAAGEYLYGHLLLERHNRRDTITAISSLRSASSQLYLDAVKRLQEMGVATQ